jgi:hypothetical protein
MNLAFLLSAAANTDATSIARLRCSEQVPFVQMLELPAMSPLQHPVQYRCKHLLQL